MSSLRVMLPDRREAECPADKAAGTVFGRDSTCDVVLADPRVSSRHLAVFAADHRGDSWFVSDLNSRHGVTVNGSKIPAGSVAPIFPGDWIGAGPAALRVLDGSKGTSGYQGQATLIDGPVSKAIAPSTISLGMAELRHISRVSAARTREELFEELLNCAMAITGYARAAVVQSPEHPDRAVDVLAFRSARPHQGMFPAISRSLVATAVQGGSAVYDDSAAAGMSIVQSLIRSACCIRMGEPTLAAAVALYLDSRDGEPLPRSGSTDAVAALANVAAACLGRLGAAEMERRHMDLRHELAGARTVQEMLLPPMSGAVLGGRWGYQLLSLPGRAVSGDIVDVIDLGADGAALVIGDVMGKGAPAGMLMAAVQARLSQGLRDGVPPERLVGQINDDTCRRCPGLTLSLWVGVLEAAESQTRLRYVDAGHGMCVVRTGAGGVETLDSGGGPMVGALESASFEAACREVEPDACIMAFTDGLTEQPDARGVMLGMDRIRDGVAACDDWRRQVESARSLLASHAGAAVQRDDVSVLVIGRGE